MDISGSFFGAREKWFKKYITLENGIPSHDTFERVFENLDIEAFNKAFINWITTITDKSKGRIIENYGKTSRRSHDGETGSN